MAMKEMNAITVADDLAKFLWNHPGHLACVHSVFPHAVNLLIQKDELITLTNQADITPMGLRVESSASFTDVLKAGDEILLDGSQFTAASGDFAVNLRDVEVWEAGLKLSLDPRAAADVAQNRLELIRWLAKQPAQGLLPLLPRLTSKSTASKPANDNIYSRYIADDLEAFTKAINTSDWERALTLVDRLIGFGMGSTPACDDFLAAYLVVLTIADASCPGQYTWIREFNQTIVRKAKNRTTLISANMLRHAASGKISRSHQRLIQTCIFNNQDDPVNLAGKVFQHGATSGGDFLLGLICALQWYQNTLTILKRKESEHGSKSINLNPCQAYDPTYEC